MDRGVASPHPGLRAPRTLAYILISQLGWLVLVMGAARGWGIVGIVYVACASGWHLHGASQPRREALLIVLVGATGWLWDSLIAHTGLLRYPNGILIAGTAPYWIAGLWALFAIQLNTLFKWLQGRPLLAAAIGAVAGPASFRAGAALHAVSFVHPVEATIFLAFGWAIWLPAALALAASLGEARRSSAIE
jgi:hypothetical protein